MVEPITLAPGAERWSGRSSRLPPRWPVSWRSGSAKVASVRETDFLLPGRTCPPGFRRSCRVLLRALCLLRVFREETGLPPHTYLAGTRVARAKDLLTRGLPLTRVTQTSLLGKNLPLADCSIKLAVCERAVSHDIRGMRAAFPPYRGAASISWSPRRRTGSGGTMVIPSSSGSLRSR